MEYVGFVVIGILVVVLFGVCISIWLIELKSEPINLFVPAKNKNPCCTGHPSRHLATPRVLGHIYLEDLDDEFYYNEEDDLLEDDDEEEEITKPLDLPDFLEEPIKAPLMLAEPPSFEPVDPPKSSSTNYESPSYEAVETKSDSCTYNSGGSDYSSSSSSCCDGGSSCDSSD